MREVTLKGRQQRLGNVIAYIEKHINKSLTLDELSEVACLSPYHFHRIFSAEIGEGVHEHIKRLRMEDAAFKLKYSDNSIDKISFYAGYERNTSFSKAFKQHFGQSPRHYRVTQHESEKGIDEIPAAKILTIDDRTVAYVREKGNYYHAAENAWQTLLSKACREGIINEGTRAYGITYDSPEITAEPQIRYDACVSLTEKTRLPDNLKIQTIPGGKYAVFRHRGAYEKLQSVYNAIYEQWLPQSGMDLRNLPSYCHYHHIDASNIPEEYLVTDIHIPVESI